MFNFLRICGYFADNSFETNEKSYMQNEKKG